MEENKWKCRLCFKKGEPNKSIDKKLSRAIKIIFDIELDSDRNICLDCTKIVADFYEYYCDVKSNQEQYKAVNLQEPEVITIKKEDDSSFSESDHFEDEPLQFYDENDFDSKAAEPKVEINEWQLQPSKSEKITSESKKQYECDLCGSEFRTYTYIKRHIHQKHLRVYDVGCKICGKRLYDTTSLKRHVDSVHKNIKQPPRRTQCPHCGITIANLSSHLKYKHPLFRGLSKTGSKSSIKAETMPDKPTTDIFICDMCSSTFVRKLYLRKHLLQKHLNIFEDHCPECNKGFYDKTAVKRHIKEHHLNERPPSKRSICIKCGKYVTAIQLHMRRVHNSNKPETKPKRVLPKVECPLCKKMISSRQDNINEHNRRVHGANIPKKIKQKKVDNKV